MTDARPSDAGPTAAQFPTVATLSARDGRQRPRWQRSLLGSGGLALVLLLLAGALIAAVVFAGAASPETEAGYRHLPADAAYAIEIRLDMPAGQRTELVEFLGGFPGFAGDAGVMGEIEERLDDAVDEVGGPDADYATDVAPWFEEWIVFGGRAEDVDDHGEDGDEGDEAGGLLVLGVRDRAAAEAALLRLRGDAEWTSVKHRGATVWSTDDAGDGPGAYAVTDDVLLLGGSTDDVTGALDTAADGSSLLAHPAFADRWRALPTGRLAAFWIDGQLLDELDAMPGVPGMPGMPRGDGSPLASGGLTGECAPEPAAPQTISGAVLVRDGRAHIETTATFADGADLPGNETRRLAERAPGDTFLFAEGGSIDDALQRMTECLPTATEGSEAAELSEDIERLQQLVGWADSGAAAARWDGTRMTAGVVLAVDDEADARAAVERLRAELESMADRPGAITFTESTHAGVTVVDVTGFDSDGEASPPRPERVLSYALAGDVLVVGVDGSFTRAVLDTASGTSLHADESFRASVEAAGGFGNSGLLYVDVPTALAVAEELDSEQRLPSGDDEAMLRGLDSVVVVSRTDGRVVVSRTVLTAGND
jgi:hypothetical protein